MSLGLSLGLLAGMERAGRMCPALAPYSPNLLQIYQNQRLLSMCREICVSVNSVRLFRLVWVGLFFFRLVFSPGASPCVLWTDSGGLWVSMIWEKLFHRLWFPGFVGGSVKVYQICNRGVPEMQDRLQAYFPHVMGEHLSAILLTHDHDFWFSGLLFIFFTPCYYHNLRDKFYLQKCSDLGEGRGLARAILNSL